MKNDIFWVDFELDNKLILNIISKCEQGFNCFGFDFEKFDLIISKKEFLHRFRKFFFGLVDSGKVIKFYFNNLDSETFKKEILKPVFRNKYFDNFICEGFEFEKEINFNESLSLEKLNLFKSFELNFIGKKVINLCNEIFNKSTLVFVDSLGGKVTESSNERFVCYLYNDYKSFKKIFNFCEKYFSSIFLRNVKKFLAKSQQIVLSFAIMKNGNLRKTIYFNVNQFSCELKKECLESFGLESSKYLDVWGIGVDFVNSNKKIKVYCERQGVLVSDFLKFLQDFKVDEFFKVLKCFKLEKLNGILFDEKMINGSIFSKRVDISLSVNKIDFKKVGEILKLDDEFFKEKNFYTLSFEFYKEAKEKINFYYSLK